MIESLLLVVAYLVGVFGGGAFVEWGLGFVLTDADRETIDAFRGNGLADGGKVIGWLERFLVMTFYLSGSHGAIGLVLAAKGIIRFGEIKDAKNQKIAEYVLIGTMLSLSWALLISVVVVQFVG